MMHGTGRKHTRPLTICTPCEQQKNGDWRILVFWFVKTPLHAAESMQAIQRHDDAFYQSTITDNPAEESRLPPSLSRSMSFSRIQNRNSPGMLASFHLH